MNISASYYSSIGGRENNEDAVSMFENNENVVGMVADGLGGHEDGDLASKLAIKTINMEISHKPVAIQTIRNAIEKANDLIIQDARHSSMKTTIAAVWFDDNNALAAHVGDTRIYQFRNNNIVYQSIDHSVAQMSYLAGDISKDAIRTSRERHTLTRALGGQDEVKVDVASLELKKHDAVLLCSDGFWEKITEEEMLEDLSGVQDAGKWLAKMRERMRKENDLKKGDNHSAVAIIIM